jgi:hypothetical protein
MPDSQVNDQTFKQRMFVVERPAENPWAPVGQVSESVSRLANKTAAGIASAALKAEGHQATDDTTSFAARQLAEVAKAAGNTIVPHSEGRHVADNLMDLDPLSGKRDRNGDPNDNLRAGDEFSMRRNQD